MSNFPAGKDLSMVGEYPPEAFGGGGYVWDAVLEYRVWCHPKLCAPDSENGDDYYYVFDKEQRVSEWPVEFLKRPGRTNYTIPNFFSPTAPANRLEILRGLV